MTKTCSTCGEPDDGLGMTEEGTCITECNRCRDEREENIRMENWYDSVKSCPLCKLEHALHQEGRCKPGCVYCDIEWDEQIEREENEDD